MAMNVDAHAMNNLDHAVEIVGADSPAEHADLKPGDRILAFGPVSSETKDSFQALTQMMRVSSSQCRAKTCLQDQ